MGLIGPLICERHHRIVPGSLVKRPGGNESSWGFGSSDSNAWARMRSTRHTSTRFTSRALRQAALRSLALA